MNMVRANLFFLQNLAGAVAPLLLTLVTTPVYLRALGDARFGVISLVWLVFGYFGLFDFGLSRATTQRLSSLVARDRVKFESVFALALRCNAVFGTGAGALFYCVAPLMFGSGAIHGEPAGDEARAAVMLIAPLLPLALLGNVFSGRMEAEERFLSLNIVQVIGAMLFQLGPLGAVLLFGPSLRHALLGAVIARATSVALLISISKPAWSSVFSVKTDWGETGRLLKYGFWITVTSGISPILVSIDQVYIGHILGAAALAPYSVAFGLASKVQTISGALAKALFPRLSRLESEGARAEARGASRWLAVALGAICCAGVLAAPKFLDLWLGLGFSQRASPVLQWLLLGYWFNGVAAVAYTLLQAQGRADSVAKLHLIELAPFLLALAFGANLFGLPGVAAAWTFRVVLDFFLLALASGMKRAEIVGLLGFAVPVVGAVAFVFTVRPDGWVSACLGVAAFCCVSAGPIRNASSAYFRATCKARVTGGAGA